MIAIIPVVFKRRLGLLIFPVPTIMLTGPSAIRADAILIRMLAPAITDLAVSFLVETVLRRTQYFVYLDAEAEFICADGTDPV